MIGIGFCNGQMMPFFDPGPAVTVTPCDWGLGEHYDRLSDCLSWVKGLGVRIPEGGRHMQYLGFLKKTRRPNEANAFYLRNLREIDYARYEVHEFDRIRRYLHDVHTGTLVDRLSIYMAGPYRYSQEGRSSANSRARDIGLELSVGAEFAKIGIEVEFGKAEDPEPLISVDGRGYAVQCKRVSSDTPASITKKIKAAAKQIRGNCASSSVNSGAVILDVTKSLNPGGEKHVNFTGQPQFCQMRERHYEMTMLCRSLMDFNRYPEVSLLIVRATYLQADSHDGLATQWVSSKKYIPNTNTMDLYDGLDRASPIARTNGVGFASGVPVSTDEWVT